MRDLVCELNIEREPRGTAVPALEEPQESSQHSLSLACWGLSAFLNNIVNISRSRILGQRWSLSKSLNHLSLLLWRKKIYLFLRKRHRTQHLIIELSWHLIYFTNRSVVKNRKQIIMLEWPEELSYHSNLQLRRLQGRYWGQWGSGSEEEGRRRGGISKEMRRKGRLPEAPQCEIIAWMNCLLYFFSWTKVLERKLILEIESKRSYTFQGGWARIHRKYLINIFAYPGPL